MSNNVTDLGKVGITPKQNWNINTQYERLDIVRYNNKSFLALEDNRGITPVDGQTWQLLVQDGAKGDTGEQGEPGRDGANGQDGYTPQKGVDYFTNAEKEEFKQAVVADSKTEMDNYTDDKKDELDTYESTKESELNTYTNSKKSDIDTHVTTKKSELDSYEGTKETVLNTLANSLTGTFNSNATQKTTDYNDNATVKTNTFNTNVESKMTDFNTNASTKTDSFNSNVTTKTNEFNAIAEQESEELTNKSSTINQKLELLGKQHFDTATVEGESIGIDDAEEFLASLIIKGRTYQDNRSEKNLANLSILNQVPSVSTGELIYLQNSKSSDFIEVDNTQEYCFSFENTGNAGRYIFFYDANKSYLGNQTDVISGYKLSTYANFQSTKFVKIRIDNSSQFRWVQLEQNSQSTDYEEYGVSPSPEFPSAIQNVTGDVEITINEGTANEETITFPLAEGQKMYEGSYLANDGIHSNRIKKIFNGNNSEEWDYYTNNIGLPSFRIRVPGISSVGNLLSNRFKNVKHGDNSQDGQFGNTSQYYNLNFVNTDITSMSDWKAWLNTNNVEIEYTSTSETIYPYTQAQQQAWEQLQKIVLNEGANNITAESDEIAPILELTYRKEKDSITELKNTVQELEENSLINITEPATSVSVNDAAKYSENKIDVIGRTYQATRSGKNKYNPSTATVQGYSNQNIQNIIELLPNTTYTFNISSRTYGTIVLYDSNNEKTRTLGGAANTNLVTFTTTEQEVKGHFTFFAYNNVNITDYDFTGVQLEEGTTATDYEQYGVSPSPEFHSPIQNVTGDIEITVNEEAITFPLAQGQKLCEGDYLADDGTHHTREQVILKGTENWSLHNLTKGIQHYYGVPKIKHNSSLNTAISNYFKGSTLNNRNLNNNIIYSGTNSICIRCDSYTTSEDWKAYLAEQYANGTPVVIEYQLLEEEVEPYTQAQQQAWEKLRKIALNKGTNNITATSDGLAPNIKLTYVQDINKRINNIESRLALLEE